MICRESNRKKFILGFFTEIFVKRFKESKKGLNDIYVCAYRVVVEWTQIYRTGFVKSFTKLVPLTKIYARQAILLIKIIQPNLTKSKFFLKKRSVY